MTILSDKVKVITFGAFECLYVKCKVWALRPYRIRKGHGEMNFSTNRNVIVLPANSRVVLLLETVKRFQVQVILPGIPD